MMNNETLACHVFIQWLAHHPEHPNLLERFLIDLVDNGKAVKSPKISIGSDNHLFVWNGPEEWKFWNEIEDQWKDFVSAEEFNDLEKSITD